MGQKWVKNTSFQKGSYTIWGAKTSEMSPFSASFKPFWALYGIKNRCGVFCTRGTNSILPWLLFACFLLPRLASVRLCLGLRTSA